MNITKKGNEMLKEREERLKEMAIEVAEDLIELDHETLDHLISDGEINEDELDYIMNLKFNVTII